MTTTNGTRRITSLLTAFSFLLVGLTGILLFLHIKSGTIIHIHEWLGVLFLFAAGVHVTLNWRLMVTYLKHPSVWVGIVGVLTACALILAMPSPERNPRNGGSTYLERHGD